MKIGVVDSGIGGITTLKVLADNIPAHYYYYMDNAHVPYGDKRPSELMDIANGIMDIFIEQGMDIVVIACNTLSAVAGDSLRRRYNVPIVCIEPSILPAARAGGSTLVLATGNTLRSEKFEHLLRNHKDMYVASIRDLATLIENNRLEEAKKLVDRELAGRIYDNIVLGCTHYVYLEEYLGSLGYRVFEGNKGVMKRLRYVMQHIDDTYNEVATYIAIHMSRSIDIDRIKAYLGYPLHSW